MNNLCLSNKERIARQFSRAASQYDDAARVQVDIAFDAINLLPAHSQRLLDIGCGTGRVTSQLDSQCEQLWALDIAEGMLRFAQEQQKNKVHWLAADAENLPFAAASFDTVFSTMALQWCEDFGQVFSEIQTVLKPDGKAVLAIMCDGSLRELEQSWRHLDANRHTNDFPDCERLKHLAAQAGFHVNIRQKNYVTWHLSLRALLGSMKRIGASVVTATGNRTSLSRSVLKELENRYKRDFAHKNQLPLTYSVCFLTLSKI